MDTSHSIHLELTRHVASHVVEISALLADAYPMMLFSSVILSVLVDGMHIDDLSNRLIYASSALINRAAAPAQLRVVIGAVRLSTQSVPRACQTTSCLKIRNHA